MITFIHWLPASTGQRIVFWGVNSYISRLYTAKQLSRIPVELPDCYLFSHVLSLPFCPAFQENSSTLFSSFSTSFYVLLTYILFSESTFSFIATCSCFIVAIDLQVSLKILIIIFLLSICLFSVVIYVFLSIFYGGEFS